eukprot:Sspe_Gene.49065::Locus_26082_Transcript_1_1_Confidence_1.000_Length_684::g.49065::m.49065
MIAFIGEEEGTKVVKAVESAAERVTESLLAAERDASQLRGDADGQILMYQCVRGEIEGIMQSLAETLPCEAEIPSGVDDPMHLLRALDAARRRCDFSKRLERQLLSRLHSKDRTIRKIRTAYWQELCYLRQQLREQGGCRDLTIFDALAEEGAEEERLIVETDSVAQTLDRMLQNMAKKHEVEKEGLRSAMREEAARHESELREMHRLLQ